LSSSLIDRGEWTIAGESYFDFPLSFSVERSASLADASWRSCITSVGHQHVQLMEAMWILVCNVPTLGHHHRAETYDDQSSQMDVIASTRVFERHCGVQLAFIIIFHHYEPFRTGWLWFRSIPTISMILTILSYKLIKITEEGILGTLLGGTSQCNSSLESGGATLQDGMARSDF
jgi:hypothetical protein